MSEPLDHKASRIRLFSLGSRPMRAFHVTWLAFFLCFFAWFGLTPLMAVVRDELGLTKAQLGNMLIASSAVTVVARIVAGWASDRFGPRLTYTWLLVLGSLPVMGVGLADSYETFLLFRLGIGVIGASFVVTEYHTSAMFAPNCVGTANATTAGWGNLGGGATLVVMPLLFGALVAAGLTEAASWRLSMVVAGLVCLLAAMAYYRLTTDLPEGNFKDLRAKGLYRSREVVKGALRDALRDRRVWSLFILYAACFGVEFTLNSIAAVYFRDNFGLGLKTASLVAGLFVLMNIFARTVGGLVGDRLGHRWGLRGRVLWLFAAVAAEGLALIVFSRMTALPLAIAAMVGFSIFVQLSEGATFAVVPFVKPRALGATTGLVGAGGSVGAVAAAFLFSSEDLAWADGLLLLGGAVLVAAFAAFGVTFSPAAEAEAREAYERAVAERRRDRALQPATRRVLGFPELARMVQPMDALRVFLGGALAVKGVYFILHMQDFETLGGALGAFNTVAAWYVVTAHIVGGLSLALGIFARLAALANVPVLLGAILFVHAKTGLFGAEQGLELTSLVLVALLLCAWNGGGRFSLDYLLNHETDEEPLEGERG